MPRRRFFLQTINDVRARTRGYLPHWELDGATYSVTFRLHDSLPLEVIDRLREERRMRERMITGGLRRLTAFECMDLRAEFEKRIDHELHESTGPACMNDPRVADIVATALTHFDGERYRLDAWCVMPNHVHAIMRPIDHWRLADILHSWKSYSSNRANEVLRRSGRFWEREYFDRILRDEQDWAEAIEYVLRNPEKAGLKDWRWTSAGGPPADRPASGRRSD
jgi:REP element-mobilizing transposase RayT